MKKNKIPGRTFKMAEEKDMEITFLPNNTSKIHPRASLVVQWLRICLSMQGTRVRALVWEDPTWHGATGPVSHGC